MIVLSPLGGAGAQFLDNNGRPLSGGKLYVYEAGTTTPATTYTDKDGAVPHANPIVLDSTGRVPGGQVWFDSNNAYKFVLQTAADVTISTWDNVSTPYVTKTADDEISVTSVIEDGTPLPEKYASILTDPAGIVAPYAGSVAPSGWLLCDGSVVNRTTYARLFAAIGTVYGVGDGSTTFSLPDLRGRAVIGVGTATGAAGATAHTLAEKGGEETHTLDASEIPAHTHGTLGLASGPYFSQIQSAGGSGVSWVDNQVLDGAGVTQTTSIGGGGAHNNMQPYIALNYIIRT